MVTVHMLGRLSRPLHSLAAFQSFFGRIMPDLWSTSTWKIRRHWRLPIYNLHFKSTSATSVTGLLIQQAGDVFGQSHQRSRENQLLLELCTITSAIVSKRPQTIDAATAKTVTTAMNTHMAAIVREEANKVPTAGSFQGSWKDDLEFSLHKFLKKNMLPALDGQFWWMLNYCFLPEPGTPLQFAKQKPQYVPNPWFMIPNKPDWFQLVFSN